MIATHNPGKLAEMRELLAPHGIEAVSAGELDLHEPEETGEMCPECGKPLLQRVGRYGPFIGCSGYPDCRYIKKQEKGTGITCPQCKQRKPTHQVCPSCGTYNGIDVLRLDAKAKQKPE